MPRYLVERTFPDGLAIPLTEAGAQACQGVIAANAEDGVTWVHSYVTPDRKRTFCVYDAPAPEAIRRVAEHEAPGGPHHRGAGARPVLLPLSRKEATMRAMHSMSIALLTLLLVSCSSMGSMTGGGGASPLAEEVRRASQPYQDVAAATAAGYALFLGCVSSPQGGAMGIHYVNSALVGDGKLDVARPEALMYEPRSGKLQLVGVEYIVLATAWDAASKTPPTLMGQVFHYQPSPNRYAIPAFYALHVWAWKPNPHGMFVDWNPRVSCDEHTAAR